MRFIMFMLPRVYAAGEDPMPTAQEVESMMEYNAALAEAGVLVSVNGLHAPDEGVRVEFAEQGATEAAVPSAGAVGGYWILTMPSHEVALEWARKCPAGPGDVVELRRIHEIDEFPQDVQDVVERYDL